MGNQNRLTQMFFTVGDRRAAIAATLKDPNGTVIDLTGHTVVFRLVHATTYAVKINDAAAIIDNAAAGTVHYDWASADVDTAGDYLAWFIISRTSDGKKEHFPGDGDRWRVTFEVAR